MAKHRYPWSWSTCRPELIEKPLAFISFDNGVCRRLYAQELNAQLAEARDACETVQLGANLLDDSLAVKYHCRRTATAPGGWSVYKA